MKKFNEFDLISQPSNRIVLVDELNELKKFINDYLKPTYLKCGFEITSQSETHFSWYEEKTKREGYFEIV